MEVNYNYPVMPSISVIPTTYGHGLHAVQFSLAGAPAGTAIIVSPLFEEKRCAHRALFIAAQTMATAGYSTLMPEFTGIGNSAGELTAINVDNWIADLRSAVAILPAGLPLTIIGCRAGALLSIAALGEFDVSRIVLWQPALSGKTYLREAILRRMSQNSIIGGEKPKVGEFEIEGQLLSLELFNGIQALKMPDIAPHADIRLLQCSFSEKILGDYARLQDRWGDALTTSAIISKPFWQPHTPYNYAELAAAIVHEVLA